MLTFLACQYRTGDKMRKTARGDEARSEPLGLRVRPAVKDALEKAAKDDERSMALYVERVLIAHLTEKGYLK